MTARGLAAGVVYVFALPLVGTLILVMCWLLLLDAVEDWFE